MNAPAREPSTRAARLLREREARGLRVSMGARMALCVFAVGVATLTSPHLEAFLVMLAILGVGMTLALKGLALARRQERLLFAGRINVVFDVCVIACLPFAWYHNMGGAAVNPAFVVKVDSLIVVMVLLCINALALRPSYPAIVTAAGVFFQIVRVAWAATDPRFHFTSDNLQQVLGEGVRPGFVVWHVVATSLCGVFLTLLAHWGRRTIESIVDLEEENLRILEAQAQAVLEAKLDALTNLVAGVAHELNSPIGAMVSTADTSARAAKKLGTLITDASNVEALWSGKANALLKILQDTSASMLAASARVKEHLGSLKSFANLDEAEHQSFDPVQSLENTLALIPQRQRGDVRVVKHFAAVPQVTGREKALNHVFMTIIKNAFEAMRGSGELRLSVEREADGVHVAVQDSGPGMDAARVNALFDLTFAERGGRVGMGLGLPNSRRIMEAHGGKIECASAPGHGTTFRITLPVRGAVPTGNAADQSTSLPAQ